MLFVLQKDIINVIKVGGNGMNTNSQSLQGNTGSLNNIMDNRSNLNKTPYIQSEPLVINIQNDVNTSSTVINDSVGRKRKKGIIGKLFSFIGNTILFFVCFPLWLYNRVKRKD